MLDFLQIEIEQSDICHDINPPSGGHYCRDKSCLPGSRPSNDRWHVNDRIFCLTFGSAMVPFQVFHLIHPPSCGHHCGDEKCLPGSRSPDDRWHVNDWILRLAFRSTMVQASMAFCS